MEAVERMESAVAPSLERVRDGGLIKPKIKSQVVTRRRSRGKISAFSVVTATLFLSCALGIVIGQIQLYSITKENGVLRNNLAKIDKNNSILQKQADERMTLIELEKIAVEQFSMSKPTHENIVFVDLSGEDHGIVSVAPTTKEKLIQMVSKVKLWISDVVS
jgi:cell division protein FtsL